MLRQGIVLIGLLLIGQHSTATPAARSTSDITLSHCTETEAIITGHSELKAYEKATRLPAVSVSDYVSEHIKRHPDTHTAKAFALQGPHHGTLIQVHTSSDYGPSFMYTPNTDYSGSDRIVWRLEIEGMKIDLIEDIHVMQGANMYGEGEPPPACYSDVTRVRG